MATEDNKIEDIDKTVVIDLSKRERDKTVVLNDDDFKNQSKNADDITKAYVKRNTDAKVTSSFFPFATNTHIQTLFEKQLDIDEHIKNSAPTTAETHLKNSEITTTAPIHNHKYHDITEDFKTISKLAEGGQGVISSAVDKKLGRIIALKSLHKNLIDNKDARDSFIAEAKITSQLDHPGVVPIYSIESDNEDGLHLAMKLVNGQNLADYLWEIKKSYKEHGIRKFNEKKSIKNRIEIIIRCCEALSYAHNRNVMHCDLKPDNIMIGEYGETYIMDWGIAKLIKDNTPREKTTQITGTPYYFAPEIINQEPYDERSDIYTLGLILFEATYLKRAFSGKEDIEILKAIREYEIAEFTHLYNANIPKDLTAVICKAVAYYPQDRYQTMAELESDLRHILDGEETTALPDTISTSILRRATRHIKLLIFVAMLGVLLGLGGLFYTVYNQIEQARTQLRQDIVLSQAYSRNIIASDKIAQQLSIISDSVRTFATNMEFLSSHKLLVSESPQNKLYVRGLDVYNKIIQDSSFKYNNFYLKDVSTEKFSYFNEENMSSEELEDTLENIQLLLPRFASIMNSSSIAFEHNANTPEHAQHITKGETAILWLHYANEQGLFCIYPGYGNKIGVPDITQRDWYIDAKRNRDLSWGVPYSDALTHTKTITCSYPVMYNDSMAGVFAADLSMSSIAQLMATVGNNSKATIKKLLINRNGEIMLNSQENYGQESIEEQIPTAYFAHPNVLELIKNRQNGHLIETVYGRKCVYMFNQIEPLKWFYVEILNYNELMKENIDK